MSKTCGECRFFESKEFICCHSGDEIAVHFIACIDFEPVTEQKPTNGDKIRQMSDEELAELLADNTCTDCGFFGISQDGAEICTMTAKDTCKDGKLAWLKQEAKDE